MAVYVQLDDGERVLLDTSKARLQYESSSIDLTGRTLSFYDQTWSVADGLVGQDGAPAKVLIFVDPFTGLRIEIPFPPQAADLIAVGLVDNGDKRRLRRFRKALGL